MVAAKYLGLWGQISSFVILGGQDTDRGEDHEKATLNEYLVQIILNSERTANRRFCFCASCRDLSTSVAVKIVQQAGSYSGHVMPNGELFVPV